MPNHRDGYCFHPLIWYTFLSGPTRHPLHFPIPACFHSLRLKACRLRCTPLFRPGLFSRAGRRNACRFSAASSTIFPGKAPCRSNSGWDRWSMWIGWRGRGSGEVGATGIFLKPDFWRKVVLMGGMQRNIFEQKSPLCAKHVYYSFASL